MLYLVCLFVFLYTLEYVVVVVHCAVLFCDEKEANIWYGDVKLCHQLFFT
jgi:hypothetical protein